MGKAEGRRGMEDTISVGSAMGIRDTVSCQVHMLPSVNSGTVGGPTPTSEGMIVGYRLRGGSQE